MLGVCGAVEHSDSEGMTGQSAHLLPDMGAKTAGEGTGNGYTLPGSGPDGRPLPGLCHTDHSDAITVCFSHHSNPPVGSSLYPNCNKYHQQKLTLESLVGLEGYRLLRSVTPLPVSLYAREIRTWTLGKEC